MSLFQTVQEKVSSGLAISKEAASQVITPVVSGLELSSKVQTDVVNPVVTEGALTVVHGGYSVLKNVARTVVEIDSGLRKAQNEIISGTAKGAAEVAGGVFQAGKEVSGAAWDVTKDVSGATLQTVGEIGGATFKTGKEVSEALGNLDKMPDADDIFKAADYILRKGDAVIDYGAKKVDDAGAYGGRKLGEGIDWTKQKVSDAGDWVGEKWAENKKNAAEELVTRNAKRLWNDILNDLIRGIVAIATKNQTIEKCLVPLLKRIDSHLLTPEEKKKREEMAKVDGHYIGAGECPVTSKEIPKKGRLPDGCPPNAKLPKILYVNGINTPVYNEEDGTGACATVRKIANARCAEVIGVYNASDGVINDVLDSKDNVDKLNSTNKSKFDKAGREKAVATQAAFIKEMLNKEPPEAFTIYAHSQGGLITQEGLTLSAMDISDKEVELLEEENEPPKNMGRTRDQIIGLAKERTNAKLKNITVYSFGTAELDWTVPGVNYHQLTNSADPIPVVIKTLQKNRGQTSNPSGILPYRFTKNFVNPIDAHSMDNVYLEELATLKPNPNRGKCC